MPDNSPASPPAPFHSLADLAPAIPPVAWLWPGWIPRGMITLLCAAAGAGKSHLALDLAHRIIAGLPWPDGAVTLEPGALPAPGRDVIYVDAEDAPQLLNQRALAWGLDRSRLFPLVAGSGLPPDLTARPAQERLLTMAAALQPALIIIDSLGSAARGAENRVIVVDALFAFLNRLALQHQCGLLLIHHLRKRSALARAPLAGDDVRGTGHIVSLARSVLGLAAVQIGLDPEPNGPRRLQLLKTNLGPQPDPLGVRFTLAEQGAVQLSYGPPPAAHHPRTQVEACARWLLDYLAEKGRPHSPLELTWPAYLAGFSRSTLFRARDLLSAQIADTLSRHNSNNRWTLANPPVAGTPNVGPPAAARPTACRARQSKPKKALPSPE